MKQTPIKVLHFVSHLNHGGLERVVRDIVLGSDALPIDHHIWCMTGLGGLVDEVQARAKVTLIPRQSRLDLLYPLRLAQRIKELAPHVVHMHSGVWFKCARAARMAGVGRIVFTEHGRSSPDLLKTRLLDSIAARSTDLIVAVSEPLLVQVQETVLRSPVPLRVIPNGVDTARFRPRPEARTRAREGLGLTTEQFVVGTFGRLVPVKAYHDLLSAFRLVVDDLGPEAHLVIGGEGPERAVLEDLSRSLGIRDSVQFLGWRQDTHELYDAFDLFGLSSVSEGTSIGLLEAMSSAVCPVVTDVGGNRDVLGPGLEECLVPVGSPQSLATTMLTLAKNPDKRAALSSIGRQRVAREFSLERMIASYSEVYEGGP